MICDDASASKSAQPPSLGATRPRETIFDTMPTALAMTTLCGAIPRMQQKQIMAALLPCRVFCTPPVASFQDM